VKYALPRKARLRKPADFKRVYEAGYRMGDHCLLIFMAPNGRPRSRVGVTVSRKHGKATQRNRLKRLLKEAFRLCQYDIPAGFDYVLIPRPRPQPPQLRELQASLRRLARRLARRIERQQARATTQAAASAQPKQTP